MLELLWTSFGATQNFLTEIPVFSRSNTSIKLSPIIAVSEAAEARSDIHLQRLHQAVCNR
jgi:hypothetical protein